MEPKPYLGLIQAKMRGKGGIVISRIWEIIKNNKLGVIVSIFTLMVAATALILFARILEKI